MTESLEYDVGEIDGSRPDKVRRTTRFTAEPNSLERLRRHVIQSSDNRAAQSIGHRTYRSIGVPLLA